MGLYNLKFLLDDGVVPINWGNLRYVGYREGAKEIKEEKEKKGILMK